MHVTFISLCEKRALGRTRRLLDRYATRIADRTWQTPITQEALDEILNALRKIATRQTAVACYLNDGRNRTRLVWTVGRKHLFGESGAVAVATKARRPSPPPPWVRTASLVAAAAGMGHDIGKATARFNEKLRDAKGASADPKSQGDRIRHEWMSVKALEQWRSRMGEWEELCDTERSSDVPRLHESFPKVSDLYAMPSSLAPEHRGLLKFSRPLINAEQAVDVAILTHHGILGPSGSGDGLPPDHSRHIRDRGETKRQPDDLFRSTFGGLGFAPDTERKLWSLVRRVRQRQDDIGDDSDYWRGITLISRAVLIAADHYVSAKVVTRRPTDVKGKSLYANTCRTSEGRRWLNQPLDWHLAEVSSCARHMAMHLENLQALPGVSKYGRDQIERLAEGERFLWQNRGAEHLEKESSFQLAPTLVLNLASTGSGKTRGNMRIAAALRPEGEPLRVSLALNLRSLTLQTHDALRRQLGITESDLACLIGDTFTLKAHQEASEGEDNDETPEGDIDVYSGVEPEPPRWLQDWMTHPATGMRDNRTMAMISSPILVSTIDYLVQAGEPGRQGHHVRALARVGSSDLILDEIDNYSPASLVAVLRVVMMAAAFGRNVIASSATLSSPVADAVVRAFNAGFQIRAALSGTPKSERRTRVTLVDDVLAPETRHFEDIKGFSGWYIARVANMMKDVISGPVRRLACIQDVEDGAPNDAQDRFKASILKAVNKLHEFQKWRHPSGKRISFGVVRVANVGPCVDTAHFLNSQPGMKATAYHAKELRIRRHLKERRLDTLFTRKDRQACPLSSDPEIKRIIEASSESEICFIVVATPVEEVGRDHDFDWAVIEPSSTASIVQMAGRVNRHRLIEVDSPNIAILDLNLRALNGQEECFVRPGNQRVASHDGLQSMTDLLEGSVGWTDKGLVVNAALHFGDGENGKCRFAKFDDRSVEKQLEGGLRAIEADPKAHNPNVLDWLTSAHYEHYVLRESARKMRLRVTRDGRGIWGVSRFTSGYQGQTWVPVNEISVDAEEARAEQHWLHCDLDTALSEAFGLMGADDGNAGMELEVGNLDLDSLKGAYFDVVMGGIHRRST